VSVVNGQESDREKHTKLMQIIDSSVVDGVGETFETIRDAPKSS